MKKVFIGIFVVVMAAFATYGLTKSGVSGEQLTYLAMENIIALADDGGPMTDEEFTKKNRL